jgi:hypothetical protein
MSQLTTRINRGQWRLLLIFSAMLLVWATIYAVFLPRQASAAQITGRKVTLSSSAGGATGVSYTFVSAALPTTTAVKSVSIDACTAASGTCTSVMAASTNATTGYAITVNGTTLTSGSNTITALAAQAASSTGTSQFGLNLRSNTSPATVGADPSGGGSGSYTANYGTTNQYRFVTGDSVASAAGATNANAFTVTYLANVPGSQAPGTYTAVMTYICTATY